MKRATIKVEVTGVSGAYCQFSRIGGAGGARRPKRGTADIDELRRAADRLAEELRDVTERELIEDFQQLRRRSKKGAHASSLL